MKTKHFFFLISILSLNYLSSQKQFALEMPQYNTLFEGYQNKVFVASKNGKVVNAKCQSAEILEDKFDGRTCLTINPKAQGEIIVYFDVVNTKGKKIGRDSVSFFVRPFPNPIVLNSTVSKASGARILIGLGPDSLISSTNFEILSIELQTIEKNSSISGNVIPASLLSNIKIGAKIGIKISYRKKSNDQPSFIEGELQVTN
jgi:hypothetical protein